METAHNAGLVYMYVCMLPCIWLCESLTVCPSSWQDLVLPPSNPCGHEWHPWPVWSCYRARMDYQTWPASDRRHTVGRPDLLYLDANRRWNRMTHWLASEPWRRTLGFRQSAFLQWRYHDVCSRHRRYHRQRSLDTKIKSISINEWADEYFNLWQRWIYLDLDQKDWLKVSWRSSQHTGVHDTSGSWDDLTTSSVDGVSVKGDVVQVESNTTDVLIWQWTLLGGPLESSDNWVLDFVQVLDSLGDIDQEIWSGALWTESPQLSGLGDIVLVLLVEEASTSLELLSWGDLVLLDVLSQTLWHVDGLHVQTVVLVWWFGQADLGGLVDDGLSVWDDWVGLDDWDTGVVLLQILQANFQVQLTGTGNNMLSRLFNDTLKTKKINNKRNKIIKWI